MRNGIFYAAAAAGLITTAQGQLALISTISGFRRLGACPSLGCIFPPDASDFLAGQYFDLEIESQAPLNGSQAYNGGNPDLTSVDITDPSGNTASAEEFFGLAEPPLERWNFTYFEGISFQSCAARKPTITSPRLQIKSHLSTLLQESTAESTWVVRSLTETRQAKNVLMFIGDGMSTSMITAARLIAHRTINGIYQSKLALDEFDTIGLQNCQSLDSFITDSANAMTALLTGHKSTVNALGVQSDSNPDVFHQPKFETIAETFRRLYNGAAGIVSTAIIGVVAHTRSRLEWPTIIEQYLNGVTANYSWTEWDGPQVLLGGGAENFYGPGAEANNSATYEGINYYDLFAARGYNVVMDNASLADAPNDERLLGIFSQGNMPVWLDRNVYTDNLLINDLPNGTNGSATDLPGLKEMTLKAVDVLEGTNDGAAASIDKQFHIFRALGDLLELDDTIRAALQHLEDLGILDHTLVVVTADHAQGYDVAGDVDTAYLHAVEGNVQKRSSIGTYAQVQDVGYLNGSLSYPAGQYFPGSWDPRFTLYSGIAADTDLKENYSVHPDGPHVPVLNIAEAAPASPIGSSSGGSGGNATLPPAQMVQAEFRANPADGEGGFITNGSLPTCGVHSLQDVPVYATGPCADMFAGSYANIDIYSAMAQCLGLSTTGGNAGGHGGNDTSSSPTGGYGTSYPGQPGETWVRSFRQVP